MHVYRASGMPTLYRLRSHFMMQGSCHPCVGRDKRLFWSFVPASRKDTVASGPDGIPRRSEKHGFDQGRVGFANHLPDIKPPSCKLPLGLVALAVALADGQWAGCSHNKHPFGL